MRDLKSIQELIKNNWEDLYVARLLKFPELNASGSTVGNPTVCSYELFEKGEKKGTYVPLDRPNEYYYTISNVHSDPAVIDDRNIYTLKETLQENREIIESSYMLRKQLNNFDKVLNKSKGRAR